MNRNLTLVPAPAGTVPTPDGSLSPGRINLAGRHFGIPEVAFDWIQATLESLDAELANELTEINLLRDGKKKLAIVSFADGKQFALKQYSDDRGLATNLWLDRLGRAGMAAPGGFRVTAPLGWSPTNRTQIADVAAGRPWSRWIPNAPAAAGQAAGEWLNTLQQLTVDLDDRSDYRSIVGMREETRRLAAQHSDWEPKLARVLASVERRLADTASATPLVPSHGDLHPNNLHLTNHPTPIVTALDLDTAGMRRPSYDVGYAIAMVLVSSWMHTRSFASGAATASALWQVWRPTGADIDAVPAEIARALIQSLHFELVTYKTGNDTLLPLWLQLATTALDAGVEELLTVSEVMGS